MHHLPKASPTMRAVERCFFFSARFFFIFFCSVDTERTRMCWTFCFSSPAFSGSKAFFATSELNKASTSACRLQWFTLHFRCSAAQACSRTFLCSSHFFCPQNSQTSFSSGRTWFALSHVNRTAGQMSFSMLSTSRRNAMSLVTISCKEARKILLLMWSLMSRESCCFAMVQWFDVSTFQHWFQNFVHVFGDLSVHCGRVGLDPLVLAIQMTVV